MKGGGSVAKQSSSRYRGSASHNSVSDNQSPTVRSKNTLAGSQVYSGNASSSRMMVKGSTNTVGHLLPQHHIQVLDEEGRDVTPLPLIAPNVSKNQRHKGEAGGSHAASGTDVAIGKESVADVLNNLESLAFGGSWNTSLWKGGVSFSNSSKASGTSTPDNEKDDDSVSMTSADSDDRDGDIQENTIKPRKEDRPAHSAKNKPEAKSGLVEMDPNKTIHLMLQETDTTCLIDIPSTCVSNEFPEEVVLVKAANAKYKDQKANRANNDNLVDRSMQTFNYASKNKEVQATALKYANAECMANQWSIYDAYASQEATAENGDGADGGKDLEMDALPGLELGSGPDASSTSVMGGSSIMNMGHAAGGDFSSGIVAVAGVGTVAHYGHDETASDTTHSSVAQGHEGSMAAQAPNASTMLDGAAAGGNSEKTVEKDVAFHILNQDSLKNSLLIAERAVVGNNYVKKLVAYRNMPDIPSEEDIAAALHQPQNNEQDEEDAASNPDDNELAEDELEPGAEEDQEGEDSGRAADSLAISIPTMQFLWSFRCDLTRGRTVQYMSWNKQNEDILAIAYSDSKAISHASPGLVLCWSLKNPEWPERVYKAQSPVTAIDFSKSTPNLLAVGYADGKIAIYDVRKNDANPVLDNSCLIGKHKETVWELKWVERERVHGDEHSRGETLVSISTDGRVTQWVLRKGLEHNDLMTLKRVNKQQESKQVHSNNGAKSGAFISRLAGGLCFDFNPNDSNMYIVGTDDGHLHRCSCSLYEQYLATHFGHTGPVYRVRWSPYLQGAFLSCSADWTVRLWHQDTEEAIFKFQSGKDNITDIAWSPASSTVFGSVSTDGRMEIWDLQYSVLDPVILHSVLDRQLTCIVFASKTPVVLIGDDNGAVNVYKLQNMSSAQASASTEEQAHRLATVISNNNQSQGTAGGNIPGLNTAAANAPATAHAA